VSTQNATITSAWSKIADTGDASVLIQAAASIEYEVAAMAAESAPTVTGHKIGGSGAAITRDLLGDGHIYARLTYISDGSASSTLVVTGSSETLS
jgi:hypothetical protein